MATVSSTKQLFGASLVFFIINNSFDTTDSVVEYNKMFIDIFNTLYNVQEVADVTATYSAPFIHNLAARKENTNVTVNDEHGLPGFPGFTHYVNTPRRKSYLVIISYRNLLHQKCP
ncbi:hypothetical protein M8J77_008204 [Diaphorina citri]|nr:hypothetical protein M8J77_008204 [Diaphorina citri]